MPDLIGMTLGKYHLVKRLGEGGMAQVYKAAQIGLARYVAIKVIHSRPRSDDDETLTDVERFEREAIAVAGLNHPNIVPVYDFGREGELYYMVMALIEGVTLKAEIEQRGAKGRPFTLTEIVSIFQALANAIDYAHARGIIHRDLKPANIMLTPERQVVLTDFGIARLLEIPGYTNPGAIIGTPAYMSPEQVNSERGDKRSDIYALGVILYEMITGRLPFVINQFQDILKHVSETVPPPSQLKPTTPKAVERVILKALTKDPEARYQSAGELAQVLAAAVEYSTGSDKQEEPWQQGENLSEAEAAGPEESAAGHPPPSFPRLSRQDWGQAPDVSIFHGREKELAQLEQWVVADNCRLVGLLGLGGIGKTTLATRLAEQIRDQFEVVIWRSLRNAPLITEILSDCLQVLSDPRPGAIPHNVPQKISRLIELFRRQRCLLVLDNLESLLRTGGETGYYQTEYEDYGELVRRVGEVRHQSCLILTSREKPREFARLEGEDMPVRSLSLAGLEYPTGRVLLENKHLLGTDEAWAALISRYSGNPLVLKLVSETIREVFDGHIADFLNEEATIFGSIRDILDQQFERLSALEQDIIFWLAIEREPVPREKLWDKLVDIVPKRDFIAALQSLRRRSLVEKDPTGFTLQNVVMEYTTDRLVEQACHDITNQSVSVLRTHALLIAQAKDYVRESQTRLILNPIVKELCATGNQQEVEEKLEKILTSLRQDQPLLPGYAVGNVLNLLVHLQSDLRRFDFSQLTIRQAYLPKVTLQDVNFAKAELIEAVFAETFGRILSLAFSPDGEQLAAGTANGEIRLWQTATGRPTLTCGGHSNWVQSVAFSPDSRLLASGSTDQTIRLWDVADTPGFCLKIWPALSARVWSVAFSPDGRILASGGTDHKIHLWDIVSKAEKPIKTLSGHSDWVKSVAFSSDGRLLVSGSNDQTVRIWDPGTGQCLQTLAGHTNQVWSVAISPDDRLVTSGSGDKTIRLWDVGTGQCLHTLSGHTDQIYSIAFSADGQLLASGGNDQVVRIWDVKHNLGQWLYTLSGYTNWISAVAFNPADLTLASGSFNQTVRLWEITRRTGRCLRTWRGYTNWISAVAFNPDGRTLASGGDDHIVRIWEIDSGRCSHIFQGHQAWLSSVAFSPDGRILATGSADQTVRLWDVAGGSEQPHHILRGHIGWIWSVGFSPDGNTLASAGEDQTIRLWDVNSGQSRRTLAGHTSRVRSTVFSPDGKLLASGSDDQTVRLWLLGGGQDNQILQGHTDWVLGVAFNSNGRLLVSGSADRTVRLWDTESTRCLKILKGHTDRVRSAAFNPVTDMLASGGEDKTIRLWDINSGQALHILAGHTDIIKSVAFSYDGNLLVSTGDDGTIKIWDIQTGVCRQSLHSDRPYERMNITGVTGLTEAQKSTLKELGAMG